MVVAGYVVELLSSIVGLVPQQRTATVTEASTRLNCKTWVHLCFLILAAVLLARFVRTGGMPMLRMMDHPPDDAPRDSADDANQVAGTHTAHRQGR